MNLTGKQLYELGVITNVIDQENVQQHGIDLNVIDIQAMDGEGFIPLMGKTQLVNYRPVVLDAMSVTDQNGDTTDTKVWRLIPGAYSVTFAQGCTIPPNQMLLIRQRSSLLRNGTILHSSVFDAGFKTERMGTVIIVMHPITIEFGARIAQIYAHLSNQVENLYNGQWQGDNQRTN